MIQAPGTRLPQTTWNVRRGEQREKRIESVVSQDARCVSSDACHLHEKGDCRRLGNVYLSKTVLSAHLDMLQHDTPIKHTQFIPQVSACSVESVDINLWTLSLVAVSCGVSLWISQEQDCLSSVFICLFIFGSVLNPHSHRCKHWRFHCNQCFADLENSLYGAFPKELLMLCH